MTRATSNYLEKIVTIINSNLPEDQQIELREAYGSAGVSSNGGSKDLSGLMTKGEVLIWLRGFQEGMAIGKKVGADEMMLDMNEVEAKSDALRS